MGLCSFAFLAYCGVEDDEIVEERSRNVKWGLWQKTQRQYIGQTQSLFEFFFSSFLSRQAP
jgi:hypothetical protein